MYKSFRVQNFRCFEDLKIDSFARVNLIAGKNNVGKSSLLEALFIHSGAYNPRLVLVVNALRGIDKIEFRPGRLEEAPWDSIFRNFDNSKEIKLSGKSSNTHRVTKLKVIKEPNDLPNKIKATAHKGADISNGILSTSEMPQILRLNSKEGKSRAKQYYLILDKDGMRTFPVTPNPPADAFYIGGITQTPKNEFAEHFGKIVIQKKLDVILDVLRIVEPKLEGITMIPAAGEYAVHGDIGLPRLMPLALMGGGINRLLEYYIYIMLAKDGVLLIDEIENGLHHAILPKVWQKITELAREFNTQIIATTHSMECVRAAHKTFLKDKKYDFKLHRLDLIDDKIRSVTYRKETLNAAISAGLEVR